MNGLNETIKTKKMPENDETEVVINTEGAVNAEAAATNRMFVRECVKERDVFLVSLRLRVEKRQQ